MNKKKIYPHTSIGKKYTERIFFLTLIFLFSKGFFVYAELSFVHPDINSKNELLFSIKSDVPGLDSYESLFLKKIDTGSLEQLTFYPEKIESLLGGSQIQIRNRFGVGRYVVSTNTFSWIQDSHPFVQGGTPTLAKLIDICTSPDGRWQISVDPTSPVRGRLVLYDTLKNIRIILAESIESGTLPVSWSPDSSVLIYSVEGILYFARPESLFSQNALDAKYRILGQGSVNSINWFSPSRFLYINESSVFLVQSSELFARALYAQLLPVGTLIGKLPCKFDPNSDSFCSAPDGSALLYAKDKRNVYYCPLIGDDFTASSFSGFAPYLLLSGNTSSVSLFWSAEKTPFVLTSFIEDGKKTYRAWRLSGTLEGMSFTRLSIPQNLSSFLASPDGSYIAFITQAGLKIYDLQNWKEIASKNDEKVVSLAWSDDSSLFIGGSNSIKKWSFKTGLSSVLLISAASVAGWDEQGVTILAEVGKQGKFQYKGSMIWEASTATRIKPAASANASWRVYIDSGSTYYANMLYIRSALSPGGTIRLISEPKISLDTLIPQSKNDKKTQTDIFSHGSRSSLRQVSLVFDAMDSVDGLPEILAVLNRYRIRASFFINGEFIRQNPAAVNEIVKAGHQTASLFFSTWDLSSSNFRIDEDFIVRGLSRNEDDFFNATGQELSLLWHAPHYVVSSEIIKAGNKAGYRYILPDVLVSDWASLEQDKKVPGLYKSSADLIEEILKTKKPGSIIAVRIGKASGTRNDYLYDKIELLINNLLAQGYNLVTIDELMKESQGHL